MKYLLYIIVFMLLLATSCSNKKGSDVDTTEIQDQLMLPESFTYRGQAPEWSKRENLDLIINWNDFRSRLDPDMTRLVADTLTLHLADGQELILPNDSVSNYYQENFRHLIRQEITINAAIPVFYPNLNHQWVYSWIFREVEHEDGSKTSRYFHEDFRIVNGQIREIYQFERKPGRE